MIRPMLRQPEVAALQVFPKHWLLLPSVSMLILSAGTPTLGNVWQVWGVIQ
jgi:hypothetical protein